MTFSLTNRTNIEQYECYGITEDNVEMINTLYPWLLGCQLIISAIGICGNCLSIPVWCSRHLNTSIFNYLLVFHSIFDIIHLLLASVDITRTEFDHLFPSVRWHHSLHVNFLYPVHNINLTCCVYMTIVLSFERYVSL